MGLIAVRLSNELERKVKAAGTISEVVRAALDLYLSDVNPKVDKVPARKKTAAGTGTRLPDDWVLTIAYAKAARDINPDITDSEIRSLGDQFKDYWHGVPGAKGRKVSWLATWRNWVRRDSKPKTQYKTAMEKRADRVSATFDYDKATTF